MLPKRLPQMAVNGKPELLAPAGDAECFAAALQFGADAVYVGDTEVDLRTAENAGLACAVVGWGFRTEEQLFDAGATRIFHSADELRGWLLD